jgi:hypothetical protein
VCYDHTISLARRSMHDPAKLSMGTLYWQLNDVWQVRLGWGVCDVSRLGLHWLHTSSGKLLSQLSTHDKSRRLVTDLPLATPNMQSTSC